MDSLLHPTSLRISSREAASILYSNVGSSSNKKLTADSISTRSCEVGCYLILPTKIQLHFLS